MLISWAWLSVLDLFNPPQPRWYIPPWRLQSGGKTNMLVRLAIDSNGGNGWWFEYWIFRERVGTRGTCGGIWLNIVEYFSQNKIFFGGYFCCVFFWCIIGCFKMIIIKLRYNYDAKTFYSTIHYLRNEHGWGAFFTKAKTSLKALTNCKVLMITLVISTTDWHG